MTWTDITHRYWGGMTAPCQVTEATFGGMTLQVLTDFDGLWICHCPGHWRERPLAAYDRATAKREARRELTEFVRGVRMALLDVVVLELAE